MVTFNALIEEPIRVMKKSFKYGLIIAGIAVIFILLATPAEVWLPFSDRFPSWFTNRPLLSYTSDTVFLLFVAWIIGFLLLILIRLKNTKF